VCAPGIGIGLLQYPRSREKDPRARAYVIDHVKPGTTFSRQFQVCNGTDEPVTAQLYAAAASVRAGAFVLAPGHEQNDLSRAISVTPSELTLPAGRPGAATATFRIPRDARAGEQYAVVYAEIPPAAHGPVTAASRAGIRVYLDIGPGGEKPSDFRIDTMQASRRKDGLPVVTARVTNTGARALDLSGDLNLSDGPAGLATGPFPAQVGTTLGLGQSGPVTIVLPKEITGGPWTARLRLHSGLLEREAEARLTFPETSGDIAPPVKAKNIPLAKDKRVLVPLAIGLIGIVLLLLFSLWLFAKLRSRRREQDEDVDASRAQ
jgi:hypothetical protein